MRKKSLLFALIIALTCLCSCAIPNKASSFEILFIDVGQGDSALVECDGHYMLIDGGDTKNGDEVYRVLQERGIQHLDILAISHMHNDHIGGLPKVLTYASQIDLTIANKEYEDSEPFRKLEHELNTNGAKIKVPHLDEEYKLGSATVKVIDVASEEKNDSLVLLITYGKTKFLFTGDIEETAQRRIQEKYSRGDNTPYKIDLIKMPHHGAKILIRFIDVFMPKYAIISVGKGNNYGHPDKDTLSMLEQAKAKVYRTDLNGDITVKSNGSSISITTSK